MEPCEAWLITFSDGSSALTTLVRHNTGRGYVELQPHIAVEIPAAATEEIKQLVSGLNVLRADFITHEPDGSGTVFQQIDQQTALGVPVGLVMMERIVERLSEGQIDLTFEIEDEE